jgi:heat shock protein HslJ
MHIRPFIQEAYQQRLQSGVTTAALSGYALINRFAGLAEIDEASDGGLVETLAGTITTHMVNLSAQTAASIDANTMQMNALMQQMAAHGAQLQQEQQAMMQQMAMPTVNQQPRWQLTLATPAPLTIPQAFPGTIAPPAPQ